jgi:hypothetical protein
MILDFAKRWTPGRVLKMKFLNGSNGIKEKVKKNVLRWIDESKANLRFEFVDDGDAEIRISFGSEPTVSMVGTELLEVEPNLLNLHFNAFDAAGLPDRKILHEFGHVLGLIHEIFHPAMPFKLRFDELKKYYEEIQGFSENEYENNVGRSFKRGEIQYYIFDADSIMMYPIPPEGNELHKEFVLPSDLSDEDKEYLRLLYPDTDNPAKHISSDRKSVV